MKITALKYGESVYGENYIFHGGDKENMLPISFVIYLIETEDKKILVDAGAEDKSGFEMSVFKKPAEVLHEYGLHTDDITDLIITHAHHDHIADVHYYENATIHIQREEYATGRSYIPEGFKVNLIEQEYTVCRGVTIKNIGGHSKGSCIVICEQLDCKYVLCGDECYYRANLERGIITGASVAPNKSRSFIEEYAKPEYVPCLFHDPDILKGKTGFSTECLSDGVI